MWIIFILFVENIVRGEKMKNLKYKKEDCFLCYGEGLIAIYHFDDCFIPFTHSECPICSGKGYLNILKQKEIADDRKN